LSFVRSTLTRDRSNECKTSIMITTNLPQLVHELTALAQVRVHDHVDTIELEVSGAVDVGQLDDLVCDALFTDPLEREQGPDGWTIHLGKRNQLRGASDMHVVAGPSRTGYVLHGAA
jgi:hypothetical protein